MSNENNSAETEEVETPEVEETEVEETEVEETYEPSKGSDAKYTKADIDRAVERRQEALKERNELRKEKAALAKELREFKKKSESDAERAEREAAESRQAAFEEASNKYKPAIVKKHIETELMVAGVKSSKLARLVRLMDLDDVKVDDNFNVSGVEDQIEILREEFPELFQTDKESVEEEEQKPKRKRAPRADGSEKPAPKTEMSSTDKLMAQLRGRR